MTRSREKPGTAFHALSLTCTGALLALAALAIAGYFIPQQEYQSQKLSDSILRAVCREQVLLERGSLLAYRLATAHESTERQQWLKKLSCTVNEMEATDRALAEDGPKSKLAGNPPPPVRAIYFEPPFYLDRQMRQYMEDARKILTWQRCATAPRKS